MKQIVLGFIIGLVGGYAVFAYTPIGNRYYLKEDDIQSYKIDKWTGTTWVLRYTEEMDENLNNIRVWYWSQLADENVAQKEVQQIRENVKKVRIQREKKQELIKQQEMKEQEKAWQAYIEKYADLIRKAKNVYNRCGNDLTCIRGGCADIEGFSSVNPFLENEFSKREVNPFDKIASRNITNNRFLRAENPTVDDCYQWIRIFIAKNVVENCKELECINQYCKDVYGYWYPKDVDNCTKDIQTTASIEIEH